VGNKQDAEIPPMERELNYLLDDLCVRWGFCIPPLNAESISKEVSISACDFASLVLEAEGMNPLSEKKWQKRISNVFKDRFGAEKIHKSSFTDRVRDIKEIWQ